MLHLSTCIWFNDQAEEAAKLYTSVFPNGKILSIARYGKEGFEFHQKPEGSVMTVEFEIMGQKFLALNGGPVFQLNEAMSIVINCDSQKEIDYYWEKLTAHGGSEGPCGWLKDRFGVSWQVNPNILSEMLSQSDRKKADQVTKAYLQMKKFDIEKLKVAFAS